MNLKWAATTDLITAILNNTQSLLHFYNILECSCPKLQIKIANWIKPPISVAYYLFPHLRIVSDFNFNPQYKNSSSLLIIAK